MAQKNKNKSKGKSKNNKATKKALNDPLSQLSGKQIKQLARTLTKLQTKPVIKAAKREAKSLRQQQKYDIRKSQAMSTAQSGQANDFYKFLFNEAQQIAGRQQAVADRSQQSLSGTGAATQTALGNIAQQADQSAAAEASYREVGNGGARQALQNMIALQSSQAAQGTEAAKSALASQQAAWGGLLQTQAMAALQQGQRAQSDIAKQGQQNIYDIQMAYRPGMMEARSKLAEARANKGAIKAQTLLDLREKERQFGLSQQAIGFDYAQLKAEQKQAAKERKHERRMDKLDRQADREADRISHERAIELENIRQAGRVDLAKLNDSLDKNGGGKGKNWGQLDLEDRKEALAIAREAINDKRWNWEWINNPSKLNKQIGTFARNADVNQGVLSQAFKRLIKSMTKKGRARGSSPKGKDLGIG